MYEKPRIEILYLNVDDVIKTSNSNPNPNPNPNPDDGEIDWG